MRGGSRPSQAVGMQTDTVPPSPPVQSTARRTLLSVLTGSAVVLTFLTGLVVGWLAINLQFFGARPSAEDYEVGAGAYGAATAALLLGAVGLRRYGTAPWQLPLTLVLAVVPGILTVSAVSGASVNDDAGPGINHWWDGAGGVLACPWTWWLLFVGVRAILGTRPVGSDQVNA